MKKTIKRTIMAISINAILLISSVQLQAEDFSKNSQNGFSKYLMSHILFDTVVLNSTEIKDEKIIISSENNQSKIGILDRFYINSDNVKINQQYTIYRKYQNISEDSFEFSEIGQAVVEEFIGGLAILKTIKSTKTIQKGDLVIQQNIKEDLFLSQLSYEKLDEPLNITHIYQNKSKGTLFDFVILEKSEIPLNVGAIYKAYSKSTIIKDPNSLEETTIPPKEKGIIVITKTHEGYNIGMISKIRKDIIKGDFIK